MNAMPSKKTIKNYKISLANMKMFFKESEKLGVLVQLKLIRQSDLSSIHLEEFHWHVENR